MKDLEEKFSEVKPYFDHYFILKDTRDLVFFISACTDFKVEIQCQKRCYPPQYDIYGNEVDVFPLYDHDFTAYFNFSDFFEYLIRYFNNDPKSFASWLSVHNFDREYLDEYLKSYVEKRQLSFINSDSDQDNQNNLFF
jgi:hypothetical protein